MKKKKLPLVCWDSIKLLTVLFLLWGVCFGADAYPGSEYRKQLFDYDWKFKLGDYPDASLNTYDDADWRILDLPHDWSIEGTLDPENPMGNDGGYFPAGTDGIVSHLKYLLSIKARKWVFTLKEFI